MRRGRNASSLWSHMAHENLDTWKTTPAVVNETVRVTKEFLDMELAKAKNWKDLNESIRILFDTEHSFIQTKNRASGVGQTVILRFLGGS